MRPHQYCLSHYLSGIHGAAVKSRKLFPLESKKEFGPLSHEFLSDPSFALNLYGGMWHLEIWRWLSWGKVLLTETNEKKKEGEFCFLIKSLALYLWEETLICGCSLRRRCYGAARGSENKRPGPFWRKGALPLCDPSGQKRLRKEAWSLHSRSGGLEPTAAGPSLSPRAGKCHQSPPL